MMKKAEKLIQINPKTKVSQAVRDQTFQKVLSNQKEVYIQKVDLTLCLR